MNYFLHFERFKDENLYLIGVANELNDKIKLFNVVDYNNDLLTLSEDLLNYVSNNKSNNANLYLHNYRDDLKLINNFIRKISQFIIKGDDEGKGEQKGNNSNFTTINLIDSKELLNVELKDFDEAYNLDIKNDIVINSDYYTYENNNAVVDVKEYTSGLNTNISTQIETYFIETRNQLKQQVDLTTQPITYVALPKATPPPTYTNIPQADEDFIIQKQNVEIALSTDNNALTLNPTSLIIESTKLNCLLLKKGLKTNNLI